MVPKIHAKGASFKGAAAYLLHDKGQATTTERVAWVETVNLATSRPESAWRVMAATAMDAPRLKDQAGVKKTGRNSKDAVLHVSLSWSPDQAPDRTEMAQFARRALKALKADDRQAMIICHNDERHSHLHLLVNRVSPNDGRLLSSSNEKNALSALALEYEKESGAILCEKRKENAERRKKGEYTRAEKDMRRADFEAMRDAQKDAEKSIPDRLAKAMPEIVATLRRETRAIFRERLAEVRQAFRDQWASLYGRQRDDQQTTSQEKVAFTGRAAKKLRGRDDVPRPSLPFLRSTAVGISKFAASQAQRQNRDRSGLAGEQRGRLATMIETFKQEYGQKLARLILRHDNKAAADPDPRAQERWKLSADDEEILERWGSKLPIYRSPKDREFEP